MSRWGRIELSPSTKRHISRQTGMDVEDIISKSATSVDSFISKRIGKEIKVKSIAIKFSSSEEIEKKVAKI